MPHPQGAIPDGGAALQSLNRDDGVGGIARIKMLDHILIDFFSGCMKNVSLLGGNLSVDDKSFDPVGDRRLASVDIRLLEDEGNGLFDLRLSGGRASGAELDAERDHDKRERALRDEPNDSFEFIHNFTFLLIDV